MSARYWPNAVPAAPVIRNFQAGAQIFGEGDEVAGPYKVLSGAVRTCRYLNDGRRQVLEFYLVDDIFGFELAAQHSASAEAIATTTVAVSPTPSTKDLGNYVDLFGLVTEQLEQAQSLNTDLARKHAHERIASFLLDLARRLQSTAFWMPMRRADIADHLGLTFETISRALTCFEKAELIRISAYKRRMELLDLPRLFELAEGRPTALRFDLHGL
jgi:CRP/FNR family nitrogen fixation transcriptional regulator